MTRLTYNADGKFLHGKLAKGQEVEVAMAEKAGFSSYRDKARGAGWHKFRKEGVPEEWVWRGTAQAPWGRAFFEGGRYHGHRYFSSLEDALADRNGRDREGAPLRKSFGQRVLEWIGEDSDRQELLDSLVHHEKGNEAEALNNEGAVAQVAYLQSRGWTVEDVRRGMSEGGGADPEGSEDLWKEDA